jgi:hypothetical protein
VPFEPMTTVHRFVVRSPDGLTRSKTTEYMDGDDAVHVEVERLNDHAKISQRMSVDDYKRLWDRVKDHVESGTDKQVFLSH